VPCQQKLASRSETFFVVRQTGFQQYTAGFVGSTGGLYCFPVAQGRSLGSSDAGKCVASGQKQSRKPEAVTCVPYHNLPKPPRPPNPLPPDTLRAPMANQISYQSKMEQLQSLRLPGTGVTDVGLRYLKALPRLQELDLWNTKVTDTGLSYLKELAELKALKVSGQDITEASLANLKTMTKLRQLELKGTKISNDACNELRKSLPDCKIVLGPMYNM
jgi:hypothetical protein